MTGSELDVTEGHPGVERRHDEGSAEHVRVDVAERGVPYQRVFLSHFYAAPLPRRVPIRDGYPSDRVIDPRGRPIRRPGPPPTTGPPAIQVRAGRSSDGECNCPNKPRVTERQRVDLDVIACAHAKQAILVTTNRDCALAARRQRSAGQCGFRSESRTPPPL
jgi:hypothetical protein